jgi:anti-anti-sigma regulatory factor
MLDITQDAPGRVALHGHCGLAQASVLLQVLQELDATEGTATLDMRGLEDLDTAALQLLLAFSRHRGSRLTLVGWRPELARRLELTGFTALL